MYKNELQSQGQCIFKNPVMAFQRLILTQEKTTLVLYICSFALNIIINVRNALIMTAGLLEFNPLVTKWV